MNSIIRLCVLAIFLPAVTWAIWVNLHTIFECHAAGGTVVQGLFSLECI
jgi:hypothetical protein